MSSVAANVARNKQKHPENYCPGYRCLWRTGGGYCPRHRREARDGNSRNNPYPPIPRERNEPTGE